MCGESLGRKQKQCKLIENMLKCNDKNHIFDHLHDIEVSETIASLHVSAIILFTTAVGVSAMTTCVSAMTDIAVQMKQCGLDPTARP